MTNTSDRSAPHTWIGILLVALGLIFLLSTLDILNLGHFLADWWPVILIVIGFLKLREPHKTSGAILFIVGIVFLSATLDIVNWGSIFRFWPLILIAVGISLLLKTRNGSWRKQSRESGKDFIKTSVLFGGTDHVVTASNFRGGDVMSIFGGVELDLRGAKASPEGCHLSLTSLFGGIDLIVPPDWQVSITGTPILGAIENKTSWVENKATTLYCHCTVAFGGIEIRN